MGTRGPRLGSLTLALLLIQPAPRLDAQAGAAASRAHAH